MVRRRELLSGAGAWALAAALGGSFPPAHARAPRLPDPPRPRTLPKPRGVFFLAPEAPVYPYPGDAAAITAQARAISDALEAHVRAWAAGRAPAELPAGLVPPGSNPDAGRLRLVRFGEIDPSRQWAIGPATPIERARPLGGHRDPNCTYLVNPFLFAPFGARLLVEGGFPRARFFDAQVSPAFDPRNYRYEAVGVGEVPIVDADVEPLPGHVNPFRPGAPRDAARRSYRLEWDMAVGDPVELEPAFRPPYFRGRGNRRVGAALAFQGPWGAPGSGGHKRGVWDFGQIWLRYYAPDRAAGPLGGVPLPRMWFELADGTRFFVESDVRGWAGKVNRVRRNRATSTRPDPRWLEGGWAKQTGIFRSIIGGLAAQNDWAPMSYVRDLDRGVTSHGRELGAPRNYEQVNTSCTYVDYLVRTMACERGHVAVLTGKLPTFPDTRGGAARFGPAEMRYWSLVGYRLPEGLDFVGALLGGPAGDVTQHALMDDELVLGPDRRYVIALSRPEDRPANARADAGVTWADWGVGGLVNWTIRWLTVGPEWRGRMTPSPDNGVGWRADPVEPDHDPAIVGRNRPGRLGPYHPVLRYLRREEFEGLGPDVAAGLAGRRG